MHLLLGRINNYWAHIHQNNTDNNTDEDPDDHWVIFELIDIEYILFRRRWLEEGAGFTLGLCRPLVCRWWVAF